MEFDPYAGLFGGNKQSGATKVNNSRGGSQVFDPYAGLFGDRQKQIEQASSPYANFPKYAQDLLNNPKVKLISDPSLDKNKKFTKEEYIKKWESLTSGTIRPQTEAEKPYFNKGYFDSSLGPTGKLIPGEVKYLDTKTGNFFVRQAKKVSNIGAAAFNTINSAITETANRFGDLFDVMSSDGVRLSAHYQAPGFSKYNPDGSLNPNFDKEFQANQDFFKKPENQVTGQERAAKALSAVASVGNLYFSQYGALIQSAKKSDLPVIKQFGEASDWVFTKVGELGAGLSEKTLDALPISEESKNIFREPFVEIGSTLFTLGTLKAVHSATDIKGSKLYEKVPLSESAKGTIGSVVQAGAGVIGNPWMPLIALKNGIQTRIEARQKAGVEVTPVEAKKIVNEVVKDTPIEMEGKMAVTTSSGEVIDVQSKQLLVLRNLIKGQESLNYKKVNSLGEDINGNPIVARFEWDYKKKEGTILVTKETTAQELAHEFGHFVDRTLTEKIGTKLSEIIPEYADNKTEVDAALASYAVDKLTTAGEKATKKAIKLEVSDLVTKLPKQVEKLAVQGGEGRSSFSEKFATAISEVMTDPIGSREKAKEFTDFILQNLSRKGFIADKMTEVAMRADAEAKAKKEQQKTEVTPEQVQQNIADKEAKKTEVKEKINKGRNATQNFVDQLAGAKRMTREKFEQTLSESNVNKATLDKVDRTLETMGATYSKSINVPKFVEEFRKTAGLKEQQNAVRTKEVIEEVRPVRSVLTEKPILVSKNKITTKGFNADKINAPEEVTKLLDEVYSNNKQFSQSRTKTTLDEMKNFSLKYLGDEKLYKGLPDAIKENRGKMLAAEQMMVDMAADLVETMRKTDISVANDAELQAMRDKLLRLEIVSQEFSGARSAAGQLLASLKSDMRVGENSIMKELFTALKEVGLDSPNLEKFFQKKRDLLQETKGEAIIGVWYSFLLSGPTTFIKNVVSTAGSVVSEVMATGLRKPSELPKAVTDLWTGLLEGYGIAKDVALGNKVRESKFTGREKVPYEFTGKAAFLNKMRIVGRLLSASDAVFYQGLKNMELGGLGNSMPTPAELRRVAEQRARREGYKGANREAKIEEYVKNPDILLGDLADSFALKGTYNEHPAGTLGAISRGIQTITGEAPVAKFIVPFTRIVANVVNRAVDFTPYGYTRITEEGGLATIAARKAGLARDNTLTPLTKRQFRQQMARATVGTAFLAFGMALAAQDKLTGDGPRDYKKRQQLMDAGWRPNSLKHGNTYVPYANLGPLALPLALAANSYESKKYGEITDTDWETRVSAGVQGTISTIFNMSFLSGVNDFMDIAKSDDPNKLQNYVGRTATSAVPNLIKQIGRIFNPTIYDTPSIWAKIQSDLRVTTDLKPKLNVFGEVVEGDRLTGLEPSAYTKDPLRKFLAENQLWISVPSKATQIEVDGQKRQMTPDEYYLYVRESGKQIHERLTGDLEYIQALGDKEEQKKAIDKVVQDIRDQVKDQVSYGELK